MDIVRGSPSVTLRVRVNRARCQGHARCAALAPELFEIDGSGDASEAGDGVVPPLLVDKAYLARANCPEFAVKIAEAIGIAKAIGIAEEENGDQA
jgi:ferredoxin